jgi:hypothetical protein
VHYLKFPLTARAAAHLRAEKKNARVELVVEHAEYSARVALGPATAASVAEDLE